MKRFARLSVEDYPGKSFAADNMMEFWNSQSCTWHILSYLNMADLEALSQTHQFLKEMVTSYLETGNQLIVDKDCIDRYPANENEHLYAKYGTLTSNLLITNIEPFEMISHFLTLSKLTLHKIQKIMKILVPKKVESTYPFLHSLQHLTMCDCVIGENYLLSWLSDLRGTLISLSLIKLIIGGRSVEPRIVLEQGFSQLQSLTLIRVHLAVKDQGVISPVLQRLKIVPTSAFTWADFKGVPITSLELEYCWGDAECPHYEMVKSLPLLTHLKIRRSVDPKQKPEIDALHLESVDVHFVDVPKEENSILILNEDCLRYLNKFLSLEDSVSLGESHPRFIGLLPLKNRNHIVDKESLKRRPVKENNEFYVSLGQWVTTLTVKLISEQEFYEIVLYFTEVESLVLDLSGELPDKTDSVDKLFQGWGRTLKFLFMRHVMPRSPIFDQLTEPQNIRQFFSTSLVITPKILQFLTQNKDHMVEFGAYHIEGLVEEFCAVVGGMRLLRSLNLEDHSRQILANGSFPELEYLDVNIPEEDNNIALTLANLDAPKIRTLVLWNQPFNFAEIILERFPGVEELVLRGKKNPEQDFDVFCDNILSLGSLTTLRFRDEFSLDSVEPIIWMMNQLPHLKELDTNSTTTPEIFSFMRFHMAQLRRGLILNKIPINTPEHPLPAEYIEYVQSLLDEDDD